MDCFNARLVQKWYSPAEASILLGFGLSTVKMTIGTVELKSIQDGGYRLILPEGVDESIQDLADQQEVS